MSPAMIMQQAGMPESVIRANVRGIDTAIRRQMLRDNPEAIQRRVDLIVSNWKRYGSKAH